MSIDSKVAKIEKHICTYIQKHGNAHGLDVIDHRIYPNFLRGFALYFPLKWKIHK